MNKLQAVLFDMDGTIIDSEKVAFLSIMDCYLEWGIRLQEADAATVAGKKWEVAFALLSAKYPLKVPAAEVSRKIIQRYREKMQTDLQVIPGAVEAIKFFHARMPLALVSGSHRAEIHSFLDRIGVLSCFQVIQGAEDYPRSKPAPDGYLQALQLLPAKAEHALVFEDSAPGIASAKAAGIRVVAISAANHFSHNLQQADWHMQNFTSVNEAWLSELEKKLW